MCVLWIYGLSGSGKSTLSKRLLEDFPQFYMIDNDSFRKGFKDSFDKETRLFTVNSLREHIIKTLECQQFILINKITPYETMREENRKYIPNYYEIYCKCPVEICKERDVKGLYKKAEQGLIEHMIGVSKDKDDIFEEPIVSPSLTLDTSKPIEECYIELKTFVEKVINETIR